MPPLLCSAKCGKRAVLKRPKTGDALCKDCFYWAFETEIHFTITKAKLFKKGDYVAIGASGGKDSTVLAYIMKTLNERFNYGLKLVLLSIDEGISGYRDDSLETVKRNRDQYEIPLKILSYQDLYGWTMDKIVETVGRKNNCTFCGVFRRQALGKCQYENDKENISLWAGGLVETDAKKYCWPSNWPIIKIHNFLPNQADIQAILPMYSRVDYFHQVSYVKIG